MSDEGVEIDGMIRRAIGGDETAAAWIRANAGSSQDAMVVTMAALLDGRPEENERALAVAATSRDRQVVAIAGAHLRGDDELVDALARDHLVDHPDSFIVAWIASSAIQRAAARDRR